jgi:hypothetical protein
MAYPDNADRPPQMNFVWRRSSPMTWSRYAIRFGSSSLHPAVAGQHHATVKLAELLPD